MTNDNQDHMDENPELGSKDWPQDIEEALDRTTKSLRSAWDATRDRRLSAMESAKKAATELGVAIDRGVEVARERWETSQHEADGAPGSAPSQGSGTDTTEEE